MKLRAAVRSDRITVAHLIHASTNAWYVGHGQSPVFAGAPDTCAIYFDTYEALDPGCCAVIEDDDGGLIGSCFWHPRSTHVSLGIMNVLPSAFGRGVARRLLEFVIARADERALPLRLVSSAQNLDSFSLYNRAGFVPVAVHQDVAVAVPERGLVTAPMGVERVRDATRDDVAAMVALERHVLGLERAKDFAHCIANRDGIWSVRVLFEGAALRGFLCASDHPASGMLGPGCAHDAGGAIALLAAELDARWRGRSPIVLAPSAHPALLAWLYANGGRNLELHLTQVRGVAAPIRGVILPTFLPETS